MGRRKLHCVLCVIFAVTGATAGASASIVVCDTHMSQLEPIRTANDTTDVLPVGNRLAEVPTPTHGTSATHSSVDTITWIWSVDRVSVDNQDLRYQKFLSVVVHALRTSTRLFRPPQAELPFIHP